MIFNLNAINLNWTLIWVTITSRLSTEPRCKLNLKIRKLKLIPSVKKVKSKKKQNNVILIAYQAAVRTFPKWHRKFRRRQWGGWQAHPLVSSGAIIDCRPFFSSAETETSSAAIFVLGLSCVHLPVDWAIFTRVINVPCGWHIQWNTSEFADAKYGVIKRLQRGGTRGW